MNRLSGKVAIVTGGASGIGEATCRLFAREGAAGVVIADIQDSLGRNLAADIEKSGGTAVFMHLDVTKEAEWVRVIRDTVTRYGRLNVVVHNAGMSGPLARARVEDATEEGWQLVMDVNATSAFLGTKHAIPEMRKAGGGSIICISSIYGIVGSRAGTAYHASKGAIRLFAKTAAVQYAADNIRVNSVHPGFTDTPMTAELHARPGVREERLSLTPLPRLGVPDDIAWGVLYLASDEASWVTGAELVIDGGMIAR
ncbi:MAG: glucose 1-dehydrogenase [Chloroflexi bacterium]|nr:glucose 1-dehydrogenase [Chloroflexota bacterium]